MISIPRKYLTNDTGKCLFGFCNNDISPKSKLFCEDHIGGVYSDKCADCGKLLSITYKRYLKQKDTGYLCRVCNGRRHANRINATPEHKELVRQNYKKFRESEKGREHIQKLVRTIQENYIGSERHIKQVKELGNKYGPLTIRDNSKDWLTSERNLEQLRRGREKGHREGLTGFRLKLCSRCGKETLHAGHRCFVCHPWEVANGSEIKHCDRCGTDTMHVGERCYICDPWDFGVNRRHCSTCGKETFHAGPRCYECDPWEIKSFRHEHCEVCGKETLHTGSRCYECDPWEGAFDRHAFYAEKIEAAEIISEQISLDSIDQYNGVPGVWSIETASGTCLEVCETIDIGAEMRLAIRKLAKGRENLFLTEDEIRDTYTRPGEYLKYRSIVARAQELGSRIVFKIIETNVKDRQDRYIIEALYAHQNRAEFWSPSPLQNIQRLLNNSSL